MGCLGRHFRFSIQCYQVSKIRTVEETSWCLTLLLSISLKIKSCKLAFPYWDKNHTVAVMEKEEKSLTVPDASSHSPRGILITGLGKVFCCHFVFILSTILDSCAINLSFLVEYTYQFYLVSLDVKNARALSTQYYWKQFIKIPNQKSC